MKRLMLLAGLLFAADAQAQNASDLPTTETQSSTQAGLPTTQTQAEPPATGGGPRAYYPGMPLPQPQQGEGAAKAGGKEPERQGVILYDDDRSSDYEGGGVSVAPGGPPVEVPDTVVVQKGDTLWDLSSRYYRN
ncbi:MAG TPA: LysM domain-containing protein, partial [Polyangia bacterium]